MRYDTHCLFRHIRAFHFACGLNVNPWQPARLLWLPFRLYVVLIVKYNVTIYETPYCTTYSHRSRNASAFLVGTCPVACRTKTNGERYMGRKLGTAMNAKKEDDPFSFRGVKKRPRFQMWAATDLQGRTFIYDKEPYWNGKNWSMRGLGPIEGRLPLVRVNDLDVPKGTCRRIWMTMEKYKQYYAKYIFGK